MRGHRPLGETGVEWKMTLPELGLGDCVMPVMSSRRGRRDAEYKVLSQVSSILVNRIFVLFCFILKKTETVD